MGNAETAEGIEGLFDAIVGVSVLHHIDLQATFAHTFSLLKPGGRFAFSEPNIRNPQVWAERNIRWLGRLRHTLSHERAFTAEDLRRQFEQAGLVVEVSEPFEFLHPERRRGLSPQCYASSASSSGRLFATSRGRSGFQGGARSESVNRDFRKLFPRNGL